METFFTGDEGRGLAAGLFVFTAAVFGVAVDGLAVTAGRKGEGRGGGEGLREGRGEEGLREGRGGEGRGGEGRG